MTSEELNIDVTFNCKKWLSIDEGEGHIRRISLEEDLKLRELLFPLVDVESE